MAGYPLSDYANTLDPHVKKRFRRFLVLVSILPWYQTKHTIQSACLLSNPWICIRYWCSTRVVKERTNLRLLEVCRLITNWFQGLLAALKDKKIGNKYIVSGKVRHSQRMNEQNGYGSLRSLCGMHGGSRGVLLTYRKCFVLHRGMESDKRKIHLYTARNEKSRWSSGVN